MGPDFRVLVKHGQKIAQKYKRTYGVSLARVMRGVADPTVHPPPIVLRSPAGARPAGQQ